MPLSLPGMPTNIRKPFFYGSFSTGPSAYEAPMKLLVQGPKLSGGTATEGGVARVSADPRADFGDGSILAEMCVAIRRQQPFVELWAQPVTATGTAATATITVNTVPSPGTYPLWVFGRFRRKEISVVSGDTVSTVAAKIAAAINTSFTFPGTAVQLAMPVTATAAVAVVTVTMRSPGTFVNNRPFVSLQAGDEKSGMAANLTVAHQNNGAGTPDVATALAGVAGQHFMTIVSAYDDLAVIDAISTWQDDQWSPVNMRYSLSVFARTGTQGTLATAGDAMNKNARIFVGMRDTMSPTWLIAASMGADLHNRYNLGMPIEQAQIMARAPMGIAYPLLEGPAVPGTAFTDAEINLLFFDGVTPLVVQFDGTVTTAGRIITTYQKSFVTGLEDTAWLDVSDVMIAAYFMYYLRDYASKVHAATSLISDDRDGREGQTRPKDYRNTCIAAYKKCADAGIVDDIDGYISDSIFEMASDRKRINARHAITRAAPFLIAANDVRVR